MMRGAGQLFGMKAAPRPRALGSLRGTSIFDFGGNDPFAELLRTATQQAKDNVDAAFAMMSASGPPTPVHAPVKAREAEAQAQIDGATAAAKKNAADDYAQKQAQIQADYQAALARAEAARQSQADLDVVRSARPAVKNAANVTVDEGLTQNQKIAIGGGIAAALLLGVLVLKGGR